MNAHVIGNAVPTPEEMGEILGLSADRVEAVRRIMSAPIRLKSSGVANRMPRTAAVKKSARSRAATQTTAKK